MSSIRLEKVKKWVKPLLSVVFLVAVFNFVDEQALLGKLKDVDPLFLALSFLLIPLMISISCAKWKVLLNLQGYRMRFSRLMSIYMIGYFFTNILPSSVGGDVVRSYYTGREIGSQTQSAVSVFLERFSGLLLLLILGICAPLLEPSLYHSLYISIPAVGAVILLAVIIYVWQIKDPLRLPDRVARWIFGFWRGANAKLRFSGLNRVVDRLEKIYVYLHNVVDHFHKKLVESASMLGTEKKQLWIVVALTLVFYLMTWVNVYLAFRTFAVHPVFLSMSAVIPSIMLVFMIPVSMGNIGLAEGAYVAYFSLLGIDPASSLAMALFMRLKLICSGGVGYIFYVTNRSGKATGKKIGNATLPSKK